MSTTSNHRPLSQALSRTLITGGVPAPIRAHVMTGFWCGTFLGVLLFAGIRISVIDIRTHRIANTDILLFGSWRHVAVGVACAAALPVSYLLLAVATRAMGLGDVKLALPIGYLTGVHSVVTVLVATYLTTMLGGARGAVLSAAVTSAAFTVSGSL